MFWACLGTRILGALVRQTKEYLLHFALRGNLQPKRLVLFKSTPLIN